MSTSTLTLAEVEGAISAILGTGQAYTRTGFSLTRAQLPALIDLRKTLMREEQRAANGVGVSFVFDVNVPST